MVGGGQEGIVIDIGEIKYPLYLLENSTESYYTSFWMYFSSGS